MLNVKVLGSGCANCKRLEAVVRKVVETRNIQAEIEKVTNYAEIMKWPIMSTPGLVGVQAKVVRQAVAARTERSYPYRIGRKHGL